MRITGLLRLARYHSGRYIWLEIRLACSRLLLHLARAFGMLRVFGNPLEVELLQHRPDPRKLRLRHRVAPSWPIKTACSIWLTTNELLMCRRHTDQEST